MVSYLRGLAFVLLVSGMIVCVAAAWFAYNDVDFYQKADAAIRHEGSLPFVVEYYQALIPHFGYIVTAIVAGIGGLVGSAMLFGLSAVLQRLERSRERDLEHQRSLAAFGR